jgi:ribosomal protein S18 acetylase RimI-like enzyme
VTLTIRPPERADTAALVRLAAEVIGTVRAETFVRSHLERHHVLVAQEEDDVVGMLAYRTDWFQCTFVSLVGVRPQSRRQGVARTLFQHLEGLSPSPRVFSSTEETNAASIRMHAALGFSPSGHIDNLPQGYRELLFYKRLLG